MNPQTPGSPEIVPTTPVLPDMPKNSPHGITVAAMAAFVLLSLGTITFLYYQNQQLKSMLANSQPMPIVTPNPPRPTVYIADFKTIDTTNWKEITINKSRFLGKFRFLVPTNVAVCDPSANLDGAPIPKSFANSQVYSILSEENTKCSSPTIFVNNDSFPYGIKIEWTALENDVPPLSGATFLKYDLGIADVTDFGFGDDKTLLSSGMTNVVYNYDPPKNTEDSKTKEIYYERVMFNRGSGVYVFTIQTDPSKKNLDIYRQIISTFKFIETSPSPSAKACTEDAKVCPDGSSVGRTAPNCEFSPCPTP